MDPIKNKVAALTKEQCRYYSSTFGFTQAVLGLPVYDGNVTPNAPTKCERDGQTFYSIDASPTWQRDVLNAIDRSGSRVSLRTANGSGKTSTIVTGAILWHLATFPNSLVISTAGVDRQLRAQLWPSLQRHEHKLEGWEFRESELTIKTPTGSRYVGFSTDKPGRAEGWHGKDVEKEFTERLRSLTESPTGSLMVIVDEAKSVPKAIFEALDRCTYQRLLYCSSPGLSDGDFYMSQTQADSSFARFTVRAADCPHADHEKNAEIIRKRGLEHPLVRSSVFAEFMSNTGSFVLTAADIEGCIANPPIFVAGMRRAFSDFAAGGDENSVGVTEGNKAWLEKAWHDTDTMRAVADFIRIFRRLGLSAEQVTGDADGLGAPMIDRMKELGFAINRAHNGAAPDGDGEFQAASEPDKYSNWGSETWFLAAEKIKRREVILENLDEETRAQMLSRRFRVDSKGRLAVESKKEMRARGMGSPDRADALFGSMRSPKVFKSIQFIGGGVSTVEEAVAQWAQSTGNNGAVEDDGREISVLPGAQC